MPENFSFTSLDKLFEKIVAAVVKGVGSDIRDYLAENPDETDNALKYLRGDKINTNLRNYVVSDTVEMKPFKRCSWKGRVLIDREHKRTITICTEQTLLAIAKRKNRSCPHYLMSIVNVENQDVPIAYEQLSFLPDITRFSQEDYQHDFQDIMEDEVSCGDDYKHLVVVYERRGLEVINISAKLLDKNLDTCMEYSLDRFIKPDFGDLTAEFDEAEMKQNDVHSLVTVKGMEANNVTTPKQTGLVTAKGQEAKQA